MASETPAQMAGGGRDTHAVDAGSIQSALDDVFDQAVVYHAFTDYMRDYEVIVLEVSDPRTGMPSMRYLRYLFRYCVEAQAVTAVRSDTWRVSLDDRLLNFSTVGDIAGYVWAVRYQGLYPGAKVVADSSLAAKWKKAIGIAFHEVRFETNGHNLSLVFHDLDVAEIDRGYAPFTATGPDDDNA